MLACQEVQKRFDVFLDGETDGRTMRDLALHVTQCASCEADLRLYERTHAAFVAFIEREVDRIDVAKLWARIEPGLAAVRMSRVANLAERWRTRSGNRWLAPGLAAAASFAAVVTIAGLRGTTDEPAPTAIASNEAHIEALDANAPHVAVWSEPGERTTAIWFANHEP
jgi:hypothetical protein